MDPRTSLWYPVMRYRMVPAMASTRHSEVLLFQMIPFSVGDRKFVIVHVFKEINWTRVSFVMTYGSPSYIKTSEAVDPRDMEQLPSVAMTTTAVPAIFHRWNLPLTCDVYRQWRMRRRGQRKTRMIEWGGGRKNKKEGVIWHLVFGHWVHIATISMFYGYAAVYL